MFELPPKNIIIRKNKREKERKIKQRKAKLF